MDIHIEQIEDAPGITRVSITGRIDAYTVERVSEELGSLIRIGTHKIVCSLKDVEFVAGPGMKALLRSMQDARKQHGDLKLCSLRPEVTRVFELAGFGKFAKLHPDERSALRDFGIDIGGSPDYEQTMIAGAGGMDQTMVAPSKKDVGFDQTMIATPGSDVGFDQTMIEAPPSQSGGEIGFDQTMIQQPRPSGGMDEDLRSKLQQAAGKKQPEKNENVCDALRKKLEQTVSPAPATVLPSDVEQTLLDQIDKVEETFLGSIAEKPPAGPGETPAPAPSAPSAPSSGAVTAPVLQPIELTLPRSEKYLSTVSQFIGSVGAFANVGTMTMVKFGVCVVEICRALIKVLPDRAGLTLRVEAGEKRLRVTLSVPVGNLNLYDHLRPKMEREVDSAPAAEAWLKKFAETVEIDTDGTSTTITLIRD